MKKLLLTSCGLGNPKIAERFLALVGKKPEQAKVLFIPTASRTEDELKYVRSSANELLSLGLVKENIVWFDDRQPLDFIAPFTQYDAIYVCGGNTFYLMQRLIKTRLDIEIKKMVAAGGLYLGVSAGSVAAGPHIKVAAVGEDGDKNDVGLKSVKCMGLTNIIISPHYQPQDDAKLAELRKTISFQIKPLTDTQAYEETDAGTLVFE